MYNYEILFLNYMKYIDYNVNNYIFKKRDECFFFINFIDNM